MTDSTDDRQNAARGFLTLLLTMTALANCGCRGTATGGREVSLVPPMVVLPAATTEHASREAQSIQRVAR